MPTPAPIASRASPPDGTYSYSFRQNSSEIGTTTISVKHGADAIRSHELASLVGQSFAVDLVLDPVTFIPKTFDARYPGAKPAVIHVAFDTLPFTETIAGMPPKHQLTPPAGSSGAVVLDGPVMSGFFFAVEQTHALAATSLCGVSPGGAVTMPMRPVVADQSARPKVAKAGDAGLTIAGLPSGDVTIWYDPATLVPDDFEVPSQAVSIVLVAHNASTTMSATPAPPPTPLPTPHPHFKSQEISFRSGDGTKLAGTLTVPEALRAPTAAVVLVHGSGPVGRDEKVGPNPIFLELSNALSNHGYVVLRYDKRGIGKSGGNARTATRDQLLADARSAVDVVSARREVSPRFVFVIGHSEGGELAPSLAAQRPHLRGIVLMAPPAIPLDRILVQQATRGLTGKTADDVRAKEEQVIAAIRAGTADVPGAAWLRSSFRIDPAQIIKRVPCPILILQGGKDFQVLAKDLPRLVDAAIAAHRDASVRIFPNDDHLFITIPAGSQSSLAEYMAPHRLDPAMVGALIAWLDARKGQLR